jgi:hypothetical protein
MLNGLQKSPNSVAGLVTKLWAEQSVLKIPAVSKDFNISYIIRTALVPIQTPIQWASELLPGEQSGQSAQLTTQPQLAPRLSMSGAVPPPHSPICFHGMDRENFAFMTDQVSRLL